MATWTDFLDARAPAGRYLRWKEVERTTGLSRTTAWRLQRKGDFPRPYVISPGRVGYLEAEVEAWRASRRQRCAHDESRLDPSRAVTPGAGEEQSATQVRTDAASLSRAPLATDKTIPRPRGRRDRSHIGSGGVQQITFDF